MGELYDQIRECQRIMSCSGRLVLEFPVSWCFSRQIVKAVGREIFFWKPGCFVRVDAIAYKNFKDCRNRG